MRIGMVAERLGVPASTIRYYEKVGLIERQHRISGRRDFDARSMLVLQFVQFAQAAGFTLAETKALLQSYSSDPGPAGMWQPFAEAKRVSIRAGCESRMAVMSAAWFVEFRHRLPWLLHVD